MNWKPPTNVTEIRSFLGFIHTEGVKYEIEEMG